MKSFKFPILADEEVIIAGASLKTYLYHMMTIDTIVKELRDVPVDRLDELYSIIHSFRMNSKGSDKKSKEILSFAGAFADMSEKDYNDFLQLTKDARTTLFDRDIKL